MARRITARQALALLQEKIDPALRRGKVERAIKELVKDGRMEKRLAEDGELSPDEYDQVEGEIRRMYAGWYQRRNVKGDFDAWVDTGEGEPYLVRLPYQREWDNERKVEIESEPGMVGTWEWPTARLVGVLRRSGEHEGKPLYYHWDQADVLDKVYDELHAQWMAGRNVPGGNEDGA